MPPNTGGHFPNFKVCHPDRHMPTWASAPYLASHPSFTLPSNSALEFALGSGPELKRSVNVLSGQRGESKMQEKGCVPQCAPSPELSFPVSGAPSVWEGTRDLRQVPCRRGTSLNGWPRGRPAPCFLPRTSRGLWQRSRVGWGAERRAGPCTQQLPGSVYLPC